MQLTFRVARSSVLAHALCLSSPTRVAWTGTAALARRQSYVTYTQTGITYPARQLATGSRFPELAVRLSRRSARPEVLLQELARLSYVDVVSLLPCCCRARNTCSGGQPPHFDLTCTSRIVAQATTRFATDSDVPAPSGSGWSKGCGSA